MIELTNTIAEGQIDDLAEELGAPCWHDLCEKDDRSSPEDCPDHALITRDELVEYIKVSLDMAMDPKALPRVMWRPISSAPKDATQFLAATEDGRMMIWRGDILATAMKGGTPGHLQFPAMWWQPLPALTA